MSIIAAFLWNKSPRPSISTLIVDEENLMVLSKSKITYLPKSYYQFRKLALHVIKDFFLEITELHYQYKKSIVLEFRIVFDVHEIPYLLPARESKLVYKLFMHYYRQTRKKIKFIKIRPQLRKRLTGKALKNFKQELRELYLVSRKKDTGYEYHLWAVALHATEATYTLKINRIRRKLVNAMWDQYASNHISKVIKH